MIRRAYLVAIGWTVAILAACSIPGKDLPELSFDLLEPDKIAHFSLFLLFGWLWLTPFPDTTKRIKLRVGMLGSIYAILTEVYQGMLPFERTPDPMDSLANMIGLFVALGSYRWIRDRIWFLQTEKNSK